MSSRLLGIATVFAIVVCAGTAQAAGTLLYGFEAPAVMPDGFFGAGPGSSVTQDTIGVTEGAHSIKYSAVTGATFVGARTETVIPAALNNPPGVKSILFDMTIGPNDVFSGAFALIGVTIFGHSPPNFGLQAQFADFEHIDGKAPGTYPVQIDLDSATNPVDFTPNQSFNQIVGQGANQLSTISAFQLFLNKSNDAPATVYIDNVRLVVPEPATCSLLGIAASALVLGARRRW